MSQTYKAFLIGLIVINFIACTSKTMSIYTPEPDSNLVSPTNLPKQDQQDIQTPVYPAYTTTITSAPIIVTSNYSAAQSPIPSTSPGNTASLPIMPTVAISQITTFTFPIRPGMPAWEKLNSREEMVKATQIPTSILQKLSDQALLEAILTYPLLIDQIAYFEHQASQAAIIHDFNGLKEFMQREKAHLVIINALTKTRQDRIKTANDEEVFNNYLHTIFIYNMLSQKSIINKLSLEEKCQLLKLALKEADEIDTPTGFNNYSHIWMSARILEHANDITLSQALKRDASFKNFINSGSTPTESQAKLIIDITNYYLKRYC